MIAAILLGRPHPTAPSLFFPWLYRFATAAGAQHVTYGSTHDKVDLIDLTVDAVTEQDFTVPGMLDLAVFGNKPAHHEVVRSGLSLVGFLDGLLPEETRDELQALFVGGLVTDTLAAPLVLSRLNRFTSAEDGNFTERVATLLDTHLPSGSFASLTLMLGYKPTVVLSRRNHGLFVYLVSHHHSFYLVVSTVTLPVDMVHDELRFYRWPLTPYETGGNTTVFNLRAIRSRWLRWTTTASPTARGEDHLRYARALTFLNDWLIGHTH